jgi:hypothetical protein
MLISSRSKSKQLPLFAPELPEPPRRINTTTPTAPSCSLNRTFSLPPPLDSLEARVRRSIAIIEGRHAA